MAILNSKTLCLVTEVNPHRQTSTVWTGATTVGEVIRIITQKTASSVTKPQEFLLKNAGKSLTDFLDAEGDFDGDAYTTWETVQPIQAHFDAAIDCEGDDGHAIHVYFTKDEALNEGAPRYMSEEKFEQVVNSVFSELQTYQ